MKYLIVLSLMVSVAQGADIRCATYSGGSYPVSNDALKLARHLKVMKCDGKKFQTAVKMLKQRVDYVEITAAQIKVIEDTKSLKRQRRVKKKLSTFSF